MLFFFACRLYPTTHAVETGLTYKVVEQDEQAEGEEEEGEEEED